MKASMLIFAATTIAALPRVSLATGAIAPVEIRETRDRWVMEVAVDPSWQLPQDPAVT
jgi:hypothetical protein